jgi:hypothetical protein
MRFSAKNRDLTPRKEGRPASFSFREISDFKALARIFLPALGAGTQAAAAA